ncbi:hypothetical protein [Planomonospora sp. ID82291]|uniref:hypothetical protein n=1 Tax=Planomonospora sp. ID82291 TaxID=2738136 RepID=UPI0018C3E97D|nr:hypothetical protein [Planomonospora sp. ID82291]MBG0818194.1 hypothetical protein [Planomonospora sp. ID82291]
MAANDYALPPQGSFEQYIKSISDLAYTSPYEGGEPEPEPRRCKHCEQKLRQTSAETGGQWVARGTSYWCRKSPTNLHTP